MHVSVSDVDKLILTSLLLSGWYFCNSAILSPNLLITHSPFFFFFGASHTQIHIRKATSVFLSLSCAHNRYKLRADLLLLLARASPRRCGRCVCLLHGETGRTLPRLLPN